MNPLVLGLHHVTALASDAQKNLDFYAGILGLRMVKKTVNFDAPEIYHLYFSNEQGAPGTIMTFFPYPTIPRGRKGKGQLTVTSFSVPSSSLDYWMKRLLHFNVSFTTPQKRFEDELILYFQDNDGLGLELVFNNKDPRTSFTYGNIPLEYSIKGFYGITLSEEGYEKTAHLLTTLMDYTFVTSHANRFRYSINNLPGTFVDLLCSPDAMQGQSGTGTVHHVAFATPTGQTQLEAREKLLKKGLNVTPVLDREYFHSIYFREPGGVLFEIATVPPGFAIDEDLAHLGQALKLPPWEEQNRRFIEEVLPPIHLDIHKFADV